MGCNFYYKNGEHVGKRNAWGLYCWGCNTPHDTLKDETKCPNCGAERYPETLEDSAAGLELGFTDGSLKREGLRSTSQFTWAMTPRMVKPLLISGAPIDLGELSELPNVDGWVVKDEYGKKYTAKEFMEVIEGCPVWNWDHIGEEFS